MKLGTLSREGLQRWERFLHHDAIGATCALRECLQEIATLEDALAKLRERSLGLTAREAVSHKAYEEKFGKSPLLAQCPPWREHEERKSTGRKTA